MKQGFLQWTILIPAFLKDISISRNGHVHCPSLSYAKCLSPSLVPLGGGQYHSITCLQGTVTH